ncbi:MAG: response regulator [Pseudomonadota bacterium]
MTTHAFASQSSTFSSRTSLPTKATHSQPRAHHDTAKKSALIGKSGSAWQNRNPAIFLLEDSSLSAGLLEAYLAAYGLGAPTWAKSIQEAQQFVPDIAAGAFDLLFFDIELPDGSGLDLIKSVRNSVSAPICAYTALASTDVVKQLDEAGFDHVFFKPMKKDDFANGLEQVISAAPN